MLDFYFIADEQPTSTASSQLRYVGGLEEEEFELAQKMGIVESHADYYGKFRWSSEQVKQKLYLFANCPFRGSTTLNNILNQASVAGLGLKAFGD